MKSFVNLCCKERCADVVKELECVKSKVTGDVMAALLDEALKRKDLKQCAQLSEVINGCNVPKTGQMAVLLVRGHSSSC